ncbi:MAG: iron dependent repressor, metal binding and dimerization domain protein [Candidatus Omnitrophica bacterium]|nr:iron dependent repressor, metal binding and dimerization domain protein [Candidatus Omnitrophota bacterium]MDD5671176.1 iron dependent repressor, metal binding and dimerization domain protein [Candidatus Omnitrophota bacterium]
MDFQEDARTVKLTEGGEAIARRIIRAHRLAERLLYDALGNISESVACEFEHTVALSLVDGICTILGHSKICPHGMKIPEGECCKKILQKVECSIIPLSRLRIGQIAFVASSNCHDDRQLHHAYLAR